MPSQRLKGLVAALFLLGAGVAAFYVFREPRSTVRLPPGSVPHTMQGVIAQAVPPPDPSPSLPTRSAPPPSFDVVRVSPQGATVIAGRAAAGSEVVVFDGDRVVARVTADRRGEFVALPAEPLPPGGRELTLTARAPLGGAEVKGEQSVVVVVPPTGPGTAALGAAPQAPVVALLDAHGGARMLQEPESARTVAAGTAKRAPLSLDVVDYDDKGAVRFSGRAAPGAAVRVYVDNGPLGDARADGAGRWTLVPGDPVAAGVHTLRADAVDGGGKVTARVELPFQRTAPALLDADTGRVVVQPGQNLWRLARAAYGNGMRYTVIYQANQGQIRDPNLIYPGQAISLPSAGQPLPVP